MITIYQGDSLEVLKQLPSESVHCVVTSPPYWQQRDYGINGQIGMEKTPEEFIDKLVAIFHEVKRVLHKTGTIWVNLGDGYAAGGKGGGGSYMEERKDRSWSNKSVKGFRSAPPGLKQKDLVGAPWMLAFALRADGWYLRSDCIWHKPTAMPESVTDRPVKSHEYLFLLSKSPQYFYDNDAVREKTGNEATPEEYEAAKGQSFHDHSNDTGMGMQQKKRADFKNLTHPLGRNKRTVWSIVTERCSEAHFATYPTKLVEPCILASTSEKGCCPNCLSPWQRQTEKDEIINYGGPVRKRADAPGAETSPTSMFRTREVQTYKTTGWKPGCKCPEHEPIPCTVLDPFHGAGTTGMVAARYFRNYIGIELNPEYIEMSRRRIEKDSPLFNKVIVHG